MLEAVLERLVSHLTSADGGADLERARETFHRHGGQVDAGEPLYESHIQLFLDHYLCDWRAEDGSRPLERYLASGASEALEREVAEACLRSARSLYRTLATENGTVHLADALGGGRFRVAGEGSAARLRSGDVFDGRLLVVSGRIRLAPGIVFHPPETHAPIDDMLARIDRESMESRDEVLDGLLRMRIRLDRFTSIRARHIYRFESLGELDILSAGWARRTAE